MTEFGVAGFLAPIPSRTADAIARYFPSLDAKAVCSEAQWYRLHRSEGRSNPTPDAAKRRLRLVRRQCVELLAELQSASWHPLRHVVRLAADDQAVDCLSDAESALTQLAVATARAERTIRPGRRQNPHRSLVLNLAKMLKASDLDASAKGGSPLCRLIEIVLDGVGELEGVANRSDAVLKIVRAAYGMR